MDVSRDIFFSRGFSKVTVDELARVLGVSKKTIYANFESKDEILNVVMDRHLAELTKRMDEIFASKDDFMERLFGLFTLVSEAIYQKGPLFMENLQRRRPDLWKKLDEYRKRQILLRYSKMLSDGVRLGFIRKEVDQSLIILVVLASVQGILNPVTISQNSLDAKLAFAGIFSIIHEGTLTDEARQKLRVLFDGKN